MSQEHVVHEADRVSHMPTNTHTAGEPKEDAHKHKTMFVCIQLSQQLVATSDKLFILL